MTQSIRKSVPVSVKSVDRSKRQIRFNASVQEVDRDGEVILTAGIEYNLEDLARRPKFCLDHDHTKPLGKIIAARQITVQGVPALEMVAEFLPEGVSADADQAYQEIIFGARDSFSIGFLPLEYDRTPVLPGQTGFTYRRVELLEASSVVLASCRNCVLTEKRCSSCPSRNRLMVDIADAPAGQTIEIIDNRTIDIIDTVRKGRGMTDSKDRTIDLTRADLEILSREIVQHYRKYIRDEIGPAVEAAVRRQVNRLRGRID